MDASQYYSLIAQVPSHSSFGWLRWGTVSTKNYFERKSVLTTEADEFSSILRVEKINI